MTAIDRAAWLSLSIAFDGEARRVRAAVADMLRGLGPYGAGLGDGLLASRSARRRLRARA